MEAPRGVSFFWGNNFTTYEVSSALDVRTQDSLQASQGGIYSTWPSSTQDNPTLKPFLTASANAFRCKVIADILGSREIRLYSERALVIFRQNKTPPTNLNGDLKFPWWRFKASCSRFRGTPQCLLPSNILLTLATRHECLEMRKIFLLPYKRTVNVTFGRRSTKAT